MVLQYASVLRGRVVGNAYGTNVSHGAGPGQRRWSRVRRWHVLLFRYAGVVSLAWRLRGRGPAAPTPPYRSGEVVGADESDDLAVGDDDGGELGRERGPVEQGVSGSSEPVR